jgi:phosphocarrier protein
MELEKKLKIINDLGIHARAAAKIVELSGRYGSSLYITKDGQEVDASNILSIMALACPKGTEITVRAAGEDSERLIQELSELVEQRFGEDR